VTTRHFLEVDDVTPDELHSILDLAALSSPPRLLEGKGVALLFQKPSLRTRNASEIAIVQLGGHPLTMQAQEVGIGEREPAADVARVLSRYHAAIAGRVFDHSTLVELAGAADVPVVNLLSDESHPCQALADLLTIREHFGKLEGIEIAYIGDFNNVARSLALAAAMTGMGIRLACPPGHGPTAADVDRIRLAGVEPVVTTHASEAASAADVVYTDVWTSMGQEAESEARRRAFEGFSVDAAVLAAAASHAVFLHCLPAHRGEEVAADVVDGPQSLVFAQAENRLHAFRGLLLWLLG
jgi:ornithine carbamoyltransferase